MTIGLFAEAVAVYRRKYRGSITRWGSTDAHTLSVGGFIGDPHGWDLAVDLEYDTGANRPGAEAHPRFPHSCPSCSEGGLKVIHEPKHDHLQPMDFPAGPVKVYESQTKTWV